jgi:CheY-like chemotaxis protein
VYSNNGGMSRQRRVLIVDDSPTNRKMLVRLLRMHNICAAPMEAEDGLQAVKMVSAAMLAKLVDAAGSSYCLEGSSRHNSGNPSCLTSASASPSAAPSGSTSAVASPPASADSSTHFLQPRTSQQLLLPDVILMDFIMPNLDGPSATEQLRQKIGYDGLIIGVTGNALSDEIDYFLRMGADRVLTKPINVDELREIIESSS